MISLDDKSGFLLIKSRVWNFISGLCIGLVIAFLTYIFSSYESIYLKNLEIESKARMLELETQLREIRHFQVELITSKKEATDAFEFFQNEVNSLSNEVSSKKEFVIQLVKSFEAGVGINVDAVAASLKPLIDQDIRLLSNSLGMWNSDSLSSTIAGDSNKWTTAKCPVGSYMVGLKVLGYNAKYCNTCIFKVQAECKKLLTAK